MLTLCFGQDQVAQHYGLMQHHYFIFLHFIESGSKLSPNYFAIQYENPGFFNNAKRGLVTPEIKKA